MFNQFKNLQDNRPENVVLQINLDVLGPDFKKILLESMNNFNMHFSKLLPEKPDISEIRNSISHISNESKTSNKAYELLQIIVLSSLSFKVVCGVVFSNYLRIISNIDNEEDKFHVLSNVVISIGEDIVRCYYSNLYSKYKKDVYPVDKNSDILSFTDWFNTLDDINKRLHKDSTLYAKIGGALLGIL